MKKYGSRTNYGAHQRPGNPCASLTRSACKNPVPILNRRSVADCGVHLRDVERSKSRHVVIARNRAEKSVATADDVMESRTRRNTWQRSGMFVEKRRRKAQLVAVAGEQPRPHAQREWRRKTRPAHNKLAVVRILIGRTADICERTANEIGVHGNVRHALPGCARRRNRRLPERRTLKRARPASAGIPSDFRVVREIAVCKKSRSADGNDIRRRRWIKHRSRCAGKRHSISGSAHGAGGSIVPGRSKDRLSLGCCLQENLIIHEHRTTEKSELFAQTKRCAARFRNVLVREFVEH